jgi:uncharacterized membrane protein (UPF0127 family)
MNLANKTDNGCSDPNATLQLKRYSDDLVLAHTLINANTFLSRLRGLMGKPELPSGTALLLDPCQSIHTCFMRFHLDVIFLDKRHTVTGVKSNVRPWKFCIAPSGTEKVIEMQAGSIADHAISTSDQLIMSGVDQPAETASPPR